MNIVCFHNPDEENGYLSNWYLSGFEVGNIRFSSMEQYMMYKKAVIFNDEKIANENDVIAFVGDGINDAPTLKRAEVGIAMGGLGTEAAIEAADIVLMSDDLSKIPTAIDIAKYTNRIIKQNLGFAVSIKIAILILSSLGLVNMWFAVFADTGLTLLAILNTLKIIKKFQ